jgi:hypothetical protein
LIKLQLILEINCIKKYCLQYIRFLGLIWGPLFLFLFTPDISSAQISVNGLLQNYNAVQTTGDHEFVAGRNRLRFQLRNSISAGNIYFETDLLHQYAVRNDETEIIIREAYFDRYYDQSDLRIGRQIITWGRATGGFVTDILSPVDLREFLTQSTEDLRIGLTAINYQHYFGANSLQLILNPVPEPDRLPASDSRWFPVQEVPSPIPFNYVKQNDGFTISDVQFAARYGLRSTNSLDLDIMLLNWTHPMPSYALNINPLNLLAPPSVELEESYHASPMAGLSLEWLIGDRWKFQAEQLFVYERLFTFLPVSVNRLEQALEDLPTAIQVLQEFEVRDDGYLLKKPWLKSMAGIETEQWSTLISLQFYLETIFNYENRILPQKLFPYGTLLASRPFLRDRLQVTTLNRYNFYARDFWIQMQGAYEIDDGFELSVGMNLFGGEPITPFYGHFTFNQYKENSFLFSRISIYF